MRDWRNATRWHTITGVRATWWAVLAAGLVPVIACRDAPLHGVVVGDPRQAAPLSVEMTGGRRYVLAADTGKLVLLYFGYTQCPDFCPMMLTDWKRVKRELGARGDGVRFVFVSVDPDRDSQPGTEAFVRGFDSTFVGLAPRQAQLDSIKDAWSVTSYKELSNSPGRSPAQYGVAHPAHAYLIDRAGRLMAMYPPETRWQDVATDLRRMF